MTDRITRLAAIAALAMCVLAMTGTARAQAHDGSAIVGTVSDATGAIISGTIVTATGPSLMRGSASATTDNSGAYRLPLLPPGTYELTARSPGFARTRRAGIVLPAGTTLTVDFRLEVESVHSEVDVRASSPMLDVRSSASSTAIDAAMLRHLPTDRVLADLLNLAPGIAKAYAPGAPDNVAFGGTQGSNAVVVEGIDATERETGAVRVTPNYNWIEQARVVALGAGAEYGRTTGAILDATIRSGSNRFSGLAEYRATAPGWVADNTGNPSFAPRSIDTSWDGDAQVGGPIRHDRLWFFAGLSYSDLVDRPAGLSGPDYTSTRNPSGIAKIDAAPGADFRLDAMVALDERHSTNEGLSVSYPTSAVAFRGRQSTSSGSSQLRWIHGSATTAEIHARGYTSPSSGGSQLPNGDAGPAPHYDVLTGVYSGNASSFASRDRNAASIGASLTHYADEFLRGSHELKFGVDFERTSTEDVDGSPGGRVYYDIGTTPYLVSIAGTSDVRASGRETALFVQDTWQLPRGVTVNAGLRTDINRGSVPVAGTVFATTPVSPRVGVAWDVAGNHRTVVRAHFGIYADPLYTNLYNFKDSTHQSPTIIDQIVPPDQLIEVEREEGYKASIDSHLSQPHVVQAFAAIERDLGSDTTVEARYIHRRFEDFIGNIDTGSVWTPVSRRDPGPDNVVGTADDGASLTLYRLANPAQRTLLVTNPGAAYRRYDALQFIGTKRYSGRWQLLAGYTWTRTAGTVASGPTFANAFLDRGDLAWYGPFADPNRLLNKDAPFTWTELKAEGTWHVSRLGGANLNAVFRRVSGAPVRRLAQFFGLNPGAEPVIAEPRISTFLPAQHTLDLRAEKTVDTGRRSLGVYVDVFNVTNQGIATSVALLSGKRYGTPLTWSDPRSVRIGLRWIF